MKNNKVQDIVGWSYQTLKKMGARFELYRGVNTQFIHMKRSRVKGLGSWKAIDAFKRHGFIFIWS